MFEALIFTAVAVFVPARYLRHRSARDDAAAALERIRLESAGTLESEGHRRRLVKVTAA